MEQWTEAEWKAAERRDQTKTYIEPEMLPWNQDVSAVWARICIAIAATIMVGWVLVELLEWDYHIGMKRVVPGTVEWHGPYDGGNPFTESNERR